MLQRMLKSLLLLFSAVAIVGCSTHCPQPVIYHTAEKIEYPKYKNKDPKIKVKKVDGNIILSVSDFKKIATKCTELNGQVTLLQNIIDAHNRYVVKLNSTRGRKQ